MTKEALDRIKEAYYSGLKVQIWFDGHWKNFDVQDYPINTDPFSEHRMYRIVGSAYVDIAEKQIADLKKENAELEAQIEKMKKYGKLLQDICVVLGNDNFMIAVQLENVVKKLWDTSEEKEGLKMVEDIENRLLKIKPHEWAEITKWEIKEND